MSGMDRFYKRKQGNQGSTPVSTASGGMDRYYKKQYYNSVDTSGVDDNYINTFVSDANSFLSGAGSFSLDYDSANRSLSDLGTRYDTLQAYFYKNRKRFDDETYGNLTSALGEFSSNFDSIKNFYSQFDSADAYNSWYENYKAQQEIINSEDFKEYSQIGASIENPSYSDATGWLQIGPWKPFAEDVGNIVTFSRDNIDEITKQIGLSGGNADMSNVVGDYRYQYMTDDEVSIYNYYLGKGETDKASEYLASLDDTLNQRWSGKIADRVSGNALSEIFFAAGAGLDQFVSGVRNLDNFFTGAQGDAPTVTQYASSQIRSELSGFMGGVYDVTQTTANMLPSILVGTVTGGTGGLITMGAGVAGNAYSEMRSLGYDEWQARGYATLVTAAEVGLQKVLGGISSLGGGSEGIFQTVASKIVPKLDNAIARVAIKLGGNMLDEGLEEAIQEILDPIIKAAVTGGDFEGIDIEQVLYSGLLGAISAGLLEGGPTIAGTVFNSSSAKNIYGNNVQDLVTESLEIDANNAHAQRMKARLDNGKNVSGYQINRLVNDNEAAMRKNDTASIQSAAENRLVELGESGDVKAIATALVKQASGEKLTSTEKRIISNSKFAQRVANELNPENIQSGEYSSAWAERIGTDRINPEEYSRLIAETETVAEATPQEPITEETAQDIEAATAGNAQEAQAVPATENATANENAAEAKIEASTDVAETEENAVTLESASKKYGAQAGAIISTYTEGQDIAKYDTAYSAAYNMGKSGVSLPYAMNSEVTAYLTEKQRELAHAAGADAAATTAKAQDEANKAKANGKTGRRKGTVKGEGVTIADLKSTFNDTQNTAYKLLSTYAEATGIDIVLFKSEANADGVFEGAQGKFKWSEDTIYIDINAGLANIKGVNDLAKYTILRTFSHEFTHFIEKWNPIWYNEFRKVVFDTLTERGENVNDLIETKQAQSEGMDYDTASREVVAEAMTDILPDANFAEELATKHKTIFDKLLDMLKEFVSDLKAYFNSIGHNSSREANALKEQVGESVKYIEDIVKLFDKVAVEAVENYQMTVAVETETNNTDGGIENAEGRTEQTERAETVHTGGDSISEGLSEKDGDRSGVSEENGGIRRDASGLRGRRGVKQTERRFSDDAFITPKAGSVEAAEMEKVVSYGIEGYVVKKSVWNKQALAFSNNGRVYIKEGIDEKYRGVVAAHELTHVMKQLQFQPYLNFIERTSDMLNTNDENADYIIKRAAKHRKIDLLDMDNTQRTNLFDEINAMVYGHYAAGHIVNDLKEKINGAFYNFDAYINELSSIHEQFKKENAHKKAVDETVDETVTETVSKTETVTIEEREKEYKKKYAPWLKRAGRRYVFNHNGAAFLSDGSFALRATEDMIGWARLEHSGTISEMDLPSAIVDTLDNATTLLTNAPLEGTLGDKPVYVFDLDGKTKAVFDKKYLSKLDGNLLYIGDYMKNFKILKAVDADGNVVGFLLPVKAGNEITNTKPSKLKSFSNKKKSAISKEVKPDVENADNRGAIQQPDADRSGDSRVLDEPQTEDVPGDAPRRDSVGDAVTRGQETRRDDVRDGSGERTRSGSSERVSQSGDLRRNDVLTEETTSEETERLHNEVTEQVAQQSTEQPKGRNFVIGDSLDLPNGEKSRYKANIEAIRLVKQLEAEGRYATEAEQAILSKYVGWGGLANAFDERKAEWAKEFKELKELLTDEEYSLARGSTLNAHYTDISVIKAMYDGLAKLGFNGGRMLEPSSGVGNFVGAMPAAMTSKVKSWTMVELDGITGLIAKYLYPNADVRIQGFEKANIPDNYMDVAISNVPFGNYAITDKAYPKKVTSAIHNYFFAKSLDKVRPGGIVMFITSSYTMNSRDNTVRRYIMQRADLLGAIRLPDSAFKGNAGTEVVTDILILKKRAANTAYAGEEFLEAPWVYPVKGNYSGANINTYFENHPEMVLGTASMDGGMYRGGSLTYKALEGRGSLADQIREAFSHIEGKMEYPATLSREKTNFAVERASKQTKENGLVVKEGKVYQNKGGTLVEINKAQGAAERISSMLEIRDAARNLMNYQQQGLNDTEIKKARTALNKVYDAFVKKYGFINSQANKNAFIEDPDRYSLFALENWNPETKKATKSDIFFKNTVAPNRTVTSAKDIAEGLIVSVNQTGGVDTALIARITGKTEADVTRELIDSRKAFKNRNGELETAEAYLSGNVRAKLRDAEALVSLDADYKHNVEALKSVMPEDVGYQDIFVNPGTPWIPNSVYSDFAAYMLGGRNSEYRQDIDITRNRDTGNFTVELKNRYLKMNAANTQKWGTSRRTFLDLFDAMLNSKSVVIKDKLDDGSFVVNKDATAAANEKIENIQKEFQEWLWRDEARRGELATLYNEVFNSIVTPKYNGENLTVNGMNAEKSLRPHQKNAVQRVISSGGNTLLAHRVGAGKTFEMAASAMKLKELGLVKKPMFAVPKSLVAQWGKEFMDIFPTAKLLVAEASDFAAANRKVFMNRIANGEYDAVIVSYEQFEKLPMSDDFTRQLYQEQIDSIIAAIEEAKADKGDKALSVKDLEKKRKSLQAKIDKLTDKAKDEGNIDFEQLGVDSLFVDEAHNFKNLFYTTSMTNVAGLGNKDGSKRAFDLYTKVRYLQQLNGGRGIVFATATPVMNSMSEMYIMQKYLQPDLLNQLGLSTFDAWAKQFGEVVNGVEIKPSGQGYRVKQSFSRFKNMSELQLLFRNFADVLTDVPGLKIPTMKGGKVNVVVCEPGQFQQDYMKELEKRADNIKNVDPSEDNMLKITSDGRKISYTQRMIDPSLPYEDGCKIFRCADNVIKEYNESKSIKGTQLIFCDMATPKGASNNNATATEDIETDMESAQLYDDLKTRLRQGGIPAKEIAFIHEADTDAKKKRLFDDVNEGRVRVLIGSTGKMGVGMNAQKRIVAIHHLDAPWRPGDVEQRDGRAFRQKNINEEVSKYTYVTEGSFDARLWDILDRKQAFINQVMNGESVGRETEDTGEVTLSAAEVKALASGSPLIMEQVELDTAIKKLESLYRAHISAVRSAKERLSKDNGQIALLEKQIASGKADIAARTDTYSDEKFSITVGNKKYTDKKEAGVALMAEATARATADSYTTVGSFAGFDLRVIKTSEGINGLLVGKQGYPFKTYSSNTTFMISQLSGVAESIDERVKLWQHNLTEVQKDIAEQEKLIAEPFAKQAELDQKRARYNEVMEILNPKEEQSLDSVAEDTVQEQSRAYLGERKYSYEWFANKPNMKVTTVDETGAINTKEARKQIKDKAIENAGKVGYYNEAGNAVVHIADTGADVIISKSGIGHSLDRRAEIVAPVALKAGEILQNAVLVNELNPREDNIKNSYVLIGAAKNKKNEPYIVSFVVNRYTNELTDMSVLYSVNAKTEPAGSLSPSITASNAGYFTDSNISIAQLLEFVNRYFPDVLPEDVLRHFGHEARPDGVLGKDTLYQQRTKTLTDRDIMAMAAEELQASGNLTDAERDALQIFKSRLSRLEGLQIDREEQGRLYKEQQFGEKVDREAAAQTLNRMHVLDAQIKAANAEVLSLEDKKVFGDILKKARTVVERKQREHDAEILKRWRDRTRNSAAIKKYRERIKADVTELTNWVLKPNNKDIVKHIPDALKNSVIPFLASIDFTSKQQLRGGEATKADAEFVKRLNALNEALENNIGKDAEYLYTGYNDLPPNFMGKLRDFIKGVQELVGQKSGEFVINKMTSEELKELSSVVRVLKAYITQINKFHANAMYQHVYDAGDNSIEALSAMSSDNGKTGGLANFVFWQQIRPAFAFERFGNGGVAIYDSLRRGQAQLAFNTQKIVDFAEKAYTTKEVNTWEKEIKEIRLGSHIVKMRVSDIMSFYELSKQPDSLRHMLGEGFRVATYTLNGKKISDNGHTLTEQDIAAIINTLTPRQKEVADALQKFMQEQGGAWGNYVSVKRFGEELFTNEQYFPINSDGRHLQSTADEQPSAASLYALLNMSFTKSRNEKANNRIVVYSIFDVFANHMASMAQYNAMALPVLDAIKWFNYQQKTEDADGNRYVANSVREQMSRVYGVPEESRPGSGRQGYAETFVLNILKAFNGTEAQGIPSDTIGMNATRRYNMAQVAYNFRVAVQQPLAITRAALLIDYGSIMKGLKLKPSAIAQNIEEMRKYSGIAAWKSLGFYDTNISRGLTDTIKHSSTFGKKVGEIGMWGAEKADILTWAGMWSASKEEVKKKQKLKPGDDGFYEAVTTVFEEIIYKTQVVDSVLTKNEFLRSKGAFARLIGSFMSEPTTTASMVIDAVDKYNADLKRGMTRTRAWEKNRRMIGRVIYSYAVSAVVLAVVQAAADALRDDDDYETFIEKWLEAFGGNLVDNLIPFNKLPILADFYDLAKELVSIFGIDTYGNPPQSVFMQWYDSLVNGVEILYNKISGEDTNYTWYSGIYKLLQAASGITGLPMATATREIITVWNNIVGAMAPSLKVKTYDAGEKNEIKYAYADGYLTFEEAVAELLEQGLVDNEDEAYFTVSGWDAGDGYSRYDAIYDVVLNGGDFDAAMDELTSHGYTEKDIYGQVKSKVGEWYRGGAVSKPQATSMLEKYTDMDSDEITETINKWSAVVVTGIEYNEIDDEFIAGNITASRAIEMYVRYGGMTQEKAAEKVTVLSFVMEHPNLEDISYSAVEAYTTYGEAYGIEAEVFYDVWKYNSSVSADVDASGKTISGSKKAKVLAYINSLSLSARQKDSLYYAFGWAQSTINEAPWH